MFNSRGTRAFKFLRAIIDHYARGTVASTEFRTHWTFHWHNFIKMRYWRQFRDSLGETSVMITYIMIDYNDNKA
jgi:hypothetical protein